MAAELQGGKARQIRIGAATLVFRDHLPALLRSVRKKFPNLKITLREGYQAELEAMLQKDELDLVVTAIEKKSAPGIRSVELIEVPLALLVEKSSPITLGGRTLAAGQDRRTVDLPAGRGGHLQAFPGRAIAGWGGLVSREIEVSSMDLIETYAASGFGIGLSVLAPNAKMSGDIRALPLTGFAPVVVGVLWRGKPSALLQAFLAEMQVHAKRLA